VSERALRPFWIHQIAEYLIGAALLAQGMQEPEPLVPLVAGGLVVVNAAVVRGPVGAFKWVGRRTHRWLDLAVMVAIAVGAAQPWVEIRSSGRGLMLVMLLPLGFLWFYTDWAERVSRRERRENRAGVRSGDVGRTAGRLAGRSYSAAREAVRKRSQPDGG
jgi:hypothetical protein